MTLVKVDSCKGFIASLMNQTRFWQKKDAVFTMKYLLSE